MTKAKEKTQRRLVFKTKEGKPVKAIPYVGQPVRATGIRLVPDEPVKQPARSPTELLVQGGLQLVIGGLFWFFDNYRIVHK